MKKKEESGIYTTPETSTGLEVLKKLLSTLYTMGMVILLSAIVGVILAFPTKWLWNFVFGSLYIINIWQAWALNVLCGILFGGKSGK